MTELLVHPTPPESDGTILRVTPAAAGWRHVGFEVLLLTDGTRGTRACGDREVCVVVICGVVELSSEHGVWTLGARPDPFSGRPDSAYLPPGTRFSVSGAAEVALCWAPAPHGGSRAQVLPGDRVVPELRGHGLQRRTIHPILMDDREAESLLVCEVLTPAGHWSSYPPHRHDHEDPPRESALEETYYHRIKPHRGFGLQRVYTDDRSLDESLAFGDRDCVLVPRGYHTVSAPPGYAVYYLNVMAGPRRAWSVVTDPDHVWRLTPGDEEDDD